MISFVKRIVFKISFIIDFLVVPIVYPAAILLKTIRKIGVNQMPKSRLAFLRVGVFPVIDHYYEPKFDYRAIKRSLRIERNLPGIKLDIDEQLNFLKLLVFSDEIKDVLATKGEERGKFHFGNNVFESGDAEVWYQMIRLLKPKKIIEIGSGYSTLLAASAINANKLESDVYSCELVCIEPYEKEWLSVLDVKLIRKNVEDLSPSLFTELGENDILFIDSSHVIRPQGDVLFEYLELLPSLNPGVVVHVHDIFTPRDYLDSWLKERGLFWNEQYLLEAFLTNNNEWKVLSALNFLHHNSYEELKRVAPFLKKDREPGSFYIKKAK